MNRQRLAELVDELVDADQALADVSRRDMAEENGHETPAFTAANSRSYEAGLAIPWWARWWAERQSERQVDWPGL